MTFWAAIVIAAALLTLSTSLDGIARAIREKR